MSDSYFERVLSSVEDPEILKSIISACVNNALIIAREYGESLSSEELGRQIQSGEFTQRSKELVEEAYPKFLQKQLKEHGLI